MSQFHELSVKDIQNITDHSVQVFLDIPDELKATFKKNVQREVDLYTIRHFNEKAILDIEAKGTPLLTQVNKETSQIVLSLN